LLTTATLRDLAADIRAATGLLTRLPIRPDAAPRGAAAAWAWPVAGAIIGGVAGPLGMALVWLGVPAGVAAATILAGQAVMTGAMHEDGLADTADGFWGGWTVARRLEIMKDSQIGTYGVLALILITLIRWSALAGLLAQGHGVWLIIGAAALSRAPMAVVQAWLPNARGSGLSMAVGRPGRAVAAAAGAVALLVAIPGFGLGIFAAALAVATVTVAVILLARRKIGGQTGDVLGATQQLSEAMVLAVAAAL
jgi:adenosylcobinamide-GDP ribazoletransferase